MYTSLLRRQLKRFIKEDSDIGPEWLEFLNAVNSSYEHYERDHQLGKQSLEISSAELRQLIVELADKKEHIGAILEAASDGILVIDEANKVEICNLSAARCLGFDNENKLIGQDISNFKIAFAENYYEIEASNENAKNNNFSNKRAFSDLLSNNLYEFSVVNKDFFPTSVELSATPVKLSNRQLKLCILRDVTNRKQYERKIAMRHQLTHLLIGSTSIEDVISKILSALCIELGWEAGFFWLDDQQNETKKTKFSHLTKKDPAWIEFQETLSQPPPERMNKFMCEELDKNCASQNGPRRRKACEIGFKRYICFSIVFEKNTFGIIELFSQNSYPRDEKMMKILFDIRTEIGIFFDHYYAQQRESELQKQLVKTARQAGMTQVATYVLHNVGNVLTTVNTASSTLQENLESSELNNFDKIATLLKEHQADLVSFLTLDEKGKLLPNYLIALGNHWKGELENYLQEIKVIKTNIQNIKKIIKMQQSMNCLDAMKEEVSINSFLKDLIASFSQEFGRQKIVVKQSFGDIPDILLDQGRLLQIMNNLIENAIDALRLKDTPEKNIIFQTSKDTDSVAIEITDNGCGMDPKNLVKIFSYGFTTKKEGHGFGLHGSAIQAKEMGGQLIASSKGVDQGATLKLSLPLH